MGYDSNTDFSNPNYHKIIWRKIMDEIVEAEGQDTSATFKKPDNIVTAKVCATSGMLPAEGQCKSVITEYFAKDTVPTKTCEVHQTVTLCDESHVKATDYCPDTTTYHYTVDEDGNVTLEDADFVPDADFMETTCPIHTKEAYEEEKKKKEDAKKESENTTYTISTLVEGGGSISGPTSAKAGESITLTFIPNEGFVISNVTIDGVAKGAITSYTFDNIASDHTVVATFAASEGGEAPPDSDVHNEDSAHNESLPATPSFWAQLKGNLKNLLGISVIHLDHNSDK